MRCPSCGSSDIAAGSRFCPRCGAAIDGAAEGAAVRIVQTVEHNPGRVVGVQTEVIQGDVYGGDIYQAQIYVLSSAGRDADWSRFLSEATPPYKGLASYTAQDHAVFKGRDREVGQVVRRIGERRITVVYGAPGVGKTSLMAAGAIPILIDNGGLVLHVHDYQQPEASIRAAIDACAGNIRLAIPPDGALPAMLAAITETTQGSLVLVLDQIERLFDPALSEEQRARFVASLAESLRRVPQELLRLVIVAQEQCLGQIDRLQDRLPNLLVDAVRLPLLDREAARAAIEEPLTVRHYPVSFVGGIVRERLIPELEDLTPGDTGIQPGQLQIVCRALYDVACGQHPPLIDDQLYRSMKGTGGIFARYMETALDIHLAADRDVARDTLVTMASPGVGAWVEPGTIVEDGVPAHERARVMERLADQELLVSRTDGNRREYAFANAVVAREARRLGGRDVEARYLAEEEVKRAWQEWLSHDDAVASRGQLRFLARSAAYLALTPVEALLLLRSAVINGEPTAIWLQRLRTDEGRRLIEQLESADLQQQPISPATSEQTTALLDLDAVPMPTTTGNGRVPFGPVVWTAVRHPEPAARRTAGLALLTVDAHTVVDRLNWALASGLDGWARRRRRAEVWGTLADGDDTFAARFVQPLPWLDRLGVWASRAWRRVVAGQQRLAWMAIGGALGVGIMLGVLRALLGMVLLYTKAMPFSAPHFYNGAILGAALALGLALAEPLLPKQDPARPTRPSRSDLGAAALVMAAFGLAHLAVAMLNGLQLARAPLVAPMGFVAGAGLALAFFRYDPDSPPRTGRALVRIGVAAAAFALVQLLFVWTGAEGDSIAIGLGRSFFDGQVFGMTGGAQWTIARGSGWATAATLIDAALLGAAIAAGLVLGLRIAAGRLARWRRLADRAWD